MEEFTLYQAPRHLQQLLPLATLDKSTSFTNLIDSPSTAMARLSTSPSPSVSLPIYNSLPFLYITSSIYSLKICYSLIIFRCTVKNKNCFTDHIPINFSDRLSNKKMSLCLPFFTNKLLTFKYSSPSLYLQAGNPSANLLFYSSNNFH
jgi:hypothetical protein